MTRVIKDRQRTAAGQLRRGQIESDLQRLGTLTLADLRLAWKERFESSPPAIRSRDVLLRLFAWEIQARVFGGLDVRTQGKLAAIAAALERDGSYEPRTTRFLSPGIVLTREWQGTVHKVTVTHDGFQLLGRSYKSLSDIARTITGTRWSGPRFFGLEQKRSTTTGSARR